MISLITVYSFAALFFTFFFGKQNCFTSGNSVACCYWEFSQLRSCTYVCYYPALSYEMQPINYFIKMWNTGPDLEGSTFSCCFTFPFILMAVQAVSLHLCVISLGYHCLFLLNTSVNIFHYWLNSGFSLGAVIVTSDLLFPPQCYGWTLRCTGLEVRSTTLLIHHGPDFQINTHLQVLKHLTCNPPWWLHLT